MHVAQVLAPSLFSLCTTAVLSMWCWRQKLKRCPRFVFVSLPLPYFQTVRCFFLSSLFVLTLRPNFLQLLLVWKTSHQSVPLLANRRTTAMSGFLDGLCDLPEGTEVSWRSFLHLEDVCSLTTLGALASGALALLALLAMLLQYFVCRGRKSSSSSIGSRRGRRRARKGAAVDDTPPTNGGKLAQSSLNDAGSGGSNDSGREESKGGGGPDDDTEDNVEDFMSSATEPLLSSAAGTSSSDRTDEQESAPDDDDDDDDDDDGDGGAGGGGGGGRGRARGPGRELPKKGTGVHWVKLLLYWAQAGYHLCMGGYFLVDGRADDPYKCELLFLSCYVGVFLSFFLVAVQPSCGLCPPSQPQDPEDLCMFFAGVPPACFVHDCPAIQDRGPRERSSRQNPAVFIRSSMFAYSSRRCCLLPMPQSHPPAADRKTVG